MGISRFALGMPIGACQGSRPLLRNSPRKERRTNEGFYCRVVSSNHTSDTEEHANNQQTIAM